MLGGIHRAAAQKRIDRVAEAHAVKQFLRVNQLAVRREAVENVGIGERAAREVKRVGLGGTTSITVRGSVIKFEGRVGMGRELADGLAAARAAQ